MTWRVALLWCVIALTIDWCAYVWFVGIAGDGGGALYVRIGGQGSISNTSVTLTSCFMTNNTATGLWWIDMWYCCNVWLQLLLMDVYRYMRDNYLLSDMVLLSCSTAEWLITEQCGLRAFCRCGHMMKWLCFVCASCMALVRTCWLTCCLHGYNGMCCNSMSITCRWWWWSFVCENRWPRQHI